QCPSGGGAAASRLPLGAVVFLLTCTLLPCPFLLVAFDVHVKWDDSNRYQDSHCKDKDDSKHDQYKSQVFHDPLQSAVPVEPMQKTYQDCSALARAVLSCASCSRQMSGISATRRVNFRS